MAAVTTTDTSSAAQLRRVVGLALAGMVGLVALVVMLVELTTSLRPLGFGLVAAVANGVSVGSVYAMVALGVALVYRATKVINFAQGAMGSLPAFLLLIVLLGSNFQAGTGLNEISTLAFVGWGLVAVLLGALLSILVNLLIVRQLANASPVTSLVATTGLALLLVSVESIAFQTKLRSFPRLLGGAPAGFKLGPFCFSQLDAGQCVPGSFAVGGLVIPWNTFLILGVLATVSLALAAFFRSPAGVALLATAQEPFAAELYGVSPKVMSSIAWGIAGALAAVAGILGGGFFEQIFPGFMTRDFLIPALVAAVLGGVTSMVGAVVGGLAVGVIYALSNSIVLAAGLNTVIPGPPQLGIFLVLIVTLLVRPRGLFGKDA